MKNFIQQYANEVSLGQLAMFITFGALIALLLFTVPAKVMLLILAGIIVLAVIVRKPEVGVLIIVVLTSSIVFEESLPLIPIGFGSLHASDVLLLFMLGSIGYRHFFDEDFTFCSSTMNTPLVLFMACALLSAILAIVHHGIDFNDVARLFRSLSYYLLFFLITNLVKEEYQLRFLIKGLITIAAIVAVAMLFQSIVGESVQLIPGRIEAAASINRKFGTLRILPPGQTLVFVAFITSVCLMVFSQGRHVIFSGMFCLALLLGLGTVLTYTRSYWIGIILCTVILLLMTKAENRMRLTTLLMAVFLLGGSVIVLFGETEGKLGTTVNAVADRFSSLFAGKELRESSSVNYRQIENKYALNQIKRHPIMGIGLGNSYRPQIYGSDDKLTYYVHNSYLYLLTDMGLVGFLSFCWFYLLFLYRAITSWKSIHDNFLRSAVVGFLISGITILPMALVIPFFMEWFSIVVIAVMIGLTESISRYAETEVQDQDPVH